MSILKMSNFIKDKKFNFLSDINTLLLSETDNEIDDLFQRENNTIGRLINNDKIETIDLISNKISLEQFRILFLIMIKLLGDDYVDYPEPELELLEIDDEWVVRIFTYG